MPQVTLRYLPLYLIICFLPSLCQQPSPVPTSFALITVTHTRAGDISQFLKFLTRYAPMDCPIITEININWNNEQSPEQLKVLQNKAQWKRPVYFHQTPNNSLNWRFNIPKESQAQVYFMIDDDITVDCEELKRGFVVWQQNAIGNIGPIVSYSPRFYQYTVQKGFEYGSASYKDVFTIGLTGLAFLSRHFLQLYFSDAMEIRAMRDMVISKNNCEDISLNWIVQYFYPELHTIIIDGNIQNTNPKVAVSATPNHKLYRGQCIQKLTEIFGINALRYKPIKDVYPEKEKRLTPLRTEIVIAKHLWLQNNLLRKGNNNPNISIGLINSQPKPVIPIVKNLLSQPQQTKTIDPLQLKIQTQIQSVLFKLDKLSLKQQQQTKNQLLQINALRQSSNQSLHLSEQIKVYLNYFTTLELALGLLVFLLLFCKLAELIKHIRSKGKEKKLKILKINSSEATD